MVANRGAIDAWAPSLTVLIPCRGLSHAARTVVFVYHLLQSCIKAMLVEHSRYLGSKAGVDAHARSNLFMPLFVRSPPIPRRIMRT